MDKNKLNELIIEHKGRFLLKECLVKWNIHEKPHEPLVYKWV